MLAVSMGTVDLFNFSFKFILQGGAFEGEIHGNLSNMCMCWVMSVSPVENKYTDSDEINYLKKQRRINKHFCYSQTCIHDEINSRVKLYFLI